LVPSKIYVPSVGLFLIGNLPVALKPILLSRDANKVAIAGPEIWSRCLRNSSTVVASAYRVIWFGVVSPSSKPDQRSETGKANYCIFEGWAELIIF